MQERQKQIPIYQKVSSFAQNQNTSFHVPGHKNGKISLEPVPNYFQEISKIDVTEIEGLDDLHAPQGIIKKAQKLASEWFGSLDTFFLVNGSTTGNLAMILAACRPDDQVLVQRNSHKSIMHGMELAGVKPVFLPPAYNFSKQRYTNASMETLIIAVKNYPDAKAIIVTYPDYFGDTFELEELIEIAHSNNMLVMVDEAHGCHFSLPFINAPSAVSLGADIVVQSAHKMTPALTMAAYLHIQSKTIDSNRIKYYLQMLQSSSPSYPILASLDLARYYLATYSREKFNTLLAYIEEVTRIFMESDYWSVEDKKPMDDPLKICIKVKEGIDIQQIKKMLEREQLYPELVTERHILFVFGLEAVIDSAILQKKLRRIQRKLNFSSNHATIENNSMFYNDKIIPLALSYASMNKLAMEWCNWTDASGRIAAENIIPYPPGIPIITRGEKIRTSAIEEIQQLMQHNINFQPINRTTGLNVYMEDGNKIKGE